MFKIVSRAKTGDPKYDNETDYGHGPHGNVVLICNFVRSVRSRSARQCQELVSNGDNDGDCDIDFIDYASFASD